MISLIEACLECLPDPNLHDRPWRPLTSTKAPLGHWCTWQSAAPRLRPTATRISSFSKRRPHEAMGRACKQSPLWEDVTARSLDLYRWDAVAKRWLMSSLTIGSSQARCLHAVTSNGNDWL